MEIETTCDASWEAHQIRELRHGWLCIKADLERLVLLEKVRLLKQEVVAYQCRVLALKAGFNPDEPRDDHGRWTSEGWYAGEPDLPLEPVYPIETLLAVLPAGRLLTAWSRLAEGVTSSLEGADTTAVTEGTGVSDTDWTLGSYKSPQKWANQIAKRDWTPEDISNTIANGEQFEAPNLINPGNTATRYQLGDRFVVRDNQTKELIQISGKGTFEPLKMSGSKSYDIFSSRHYRLYYHSRRSTHSMELKMNEGTVEIYVQLLEEGTPTVRGTQAIPLPNGVYKLLPTPDYDPQDEIWEFLPGSIVQCEARDNWGKEILLAVKQVR